MIMFLKSVIRLQRCHRFHQRMASQLVYSDNGSPKDVIKLTQVPDPISTDLKDKQVIIRMQMASINPADLNTIEGKYPIQQTLPAIGGGDGFGIVEAVGSSVSQVRPGDWVIPGENMGGTWATHILKDEDKLIRISDKIPVEVASNLRNPATAFRMLKDFVSLTKDDVVIQNGANSACGQFVIQICKALGVKSVNIVRDRDTIAELKQNLKDMGADEVLTEEELRKSTLFRSKAMPAPRLAINCVGGASCTEIAKTLGHGGVLVTYGGMSMKPVILPTSAFIFKDISSKGFWLSRWFKEASRHQIQALFDELGQLAVKGHIQPSKHKLVPLSDYKSALDESSQGFKDGKLILDLR